MKRLSGDQVGPRAHHARTADFFDLALPVFDDPVAAQQAHPIVRFVRDLDVVLEEPGEVGFAPLVGEARFDIHPDPAGLRGRSESVLTHGFIVARSRRPGVAAAGPAAAARLGADRVAGVRSAGALREACESRRPAVAGAAVFHRGGARRESGPVACPREKGPAPGRRGESSRPYPRRRDAGRLLHGLAGVLVFLAAVCEGAPAGEPRLLVLAVDGGGQELVEGFLRDGALPNLARLRDEGAFSDGMVTAFPSKTAPSFSMIWTGLPGAATGITGNAVLALPPDEHSLLDTRDGFSAEVLRADPLWTRAARAGRRAVALHTTHTFPLAAATRALSGSERDRLFLLTGYGEVRLPPETLNERRAPLLAEPPVPLPPMVPPRPEPADARFFRFEVGDSRFLGMFFDDDADPAAGWDTFGVLAEPPVTRPPAQPAVFLARVGVGPEAAFSGPIGAESGGRRVEFQVRAFAAEPPSPGAPARFTVFRSGASGVAIHPESAWRQRLGEPWWPRALGAPEYASGRLGRPRAEGGNGDAEARLLEVAAAVADAALTHLEAAASLPEWSLIALYLPIVDEMGHLLYGMLDERLPSHDPSLAADLRPVLRAAFGEVDRVLGRLLALAETAGAHLLVVSDHGMAGTDRLVHLNVALQEAGLLSFGPEGAVDLSRTKAMLLTTADGSIGLNRAARPEGIVPPEEEERVLDAVRSALLAIRADGEPVVSGFLEPSAHGLVRPGGASTGDLFPLLRPGFLPSARPAAEVVRPVRSAGNHGFLPTRRDMLALLGAWGPRIPAGTEWRRASALDVAPTAFDLLGMPPDPSLPGRSLLGGSPLVQPGGSAEGSGRGTLSGGVRR